MDRFQKCLVQRDRELTGFWTSVNENRRISIYKGQKLRFVLEMCFSAGKNVNTNATKTTNPDNPRTIKLHDRSHIGVFYYHTKNEKHRSGQCRTAARTQEKCAQMTGAIVAGLSWLHNSKQSKSKSKSNVQKRHSKQIKGRVHETKANPKPTP